MSGYKSPSEILAAEALTTFRASLVEDIQCPEALELEAAYRLENLVRLLESGEWVNDVQGNVYPTSTTTQDRVEIARNCRFTIIDKPPETLHISRQQLRWTAVGALLCNVTVRGDIDTIYPSINFRNSHVVDAIINI